MTLIKTEKGKLLDGVPFGEVQHVDFEIRLPVMQDSGQALDDTEEKFGTIESYSADAFYRVAVLASALVHLGDIPPEELTAELLYSNLTEDDHTRLNDAITRLKVKRHGGNPGSPDSDSPRSPSASTASQSSK